MSKETRIPGKGRRTAGQGIALRMRRMEMVGQGEGEARKLKPRQVSWGPRRSRNVPRDQWGLFKSLEWQSRESEGTLKTKCTHLIAGPGTSP